MTDVEVAIGLVIEAISNIFETSIGTNSGTHWLWPKALRHTVFPFRMTKITAPGKSLRIMASFMTLSTRARRDEDIPTDSGISKGFILGLVWQPARKTRTDRTEQIAILGNDFISDILKMPT
jgi:hypothetical protein